MSSEQAPVTLTGQRAALDSWLVPKIDGAAAALVQHWLLCVNVLNGVLFGGAFVAPYLLSIGARPPAAALYFAYSFVCHQLPYRSYFIFDNQVAQCQRNTAIFATLLMAGLAYVPLRRRIKPLAWWCYALLILPMAIDGTTQLFGWRESNWELRTLTGTLFAFATVWLLYPYVDSKLPLANPSRRPPARVVLYGKADCPLCDKAKAVVERLQDDYALTVEEIDITGDPELMQRFQYLIPVVYVNGRPAAISKVSELWLRRKIDELS